MLANVPHPQISPITGFPTSDLDHVWPQSRKTQGTNFAFYSFCAVLTVILYFNTSGATVAGNLLIAAFVLCSAFAMASYYYFINYRNHVSLNDELPLWSQRLLRGIAFLLPLALICSTEAIILINVFTPIPWPTQSAVVIPASLNNMTLAGETFMANKYYYENKFDVSIVHFKNVLLFDPKNEIACQRISDAYTRTSPVQPKLSIEYADKALAINPRNLYAQCTKAYSLNWLDRYKEALALSLAASNQASTFGEAYATAAYSYRKLGQLDRALVAANTHMRLHGKESQAFEIRAAIYDAMGRKTEASADWRKVSEMQAKAKANAKKGS
ncbi:MAG: hypothetical protein IAF58_07745 [Leptolyngbya sp.]|nr:hypothetical protein [Candidatus Melainabacteria bacterium]